MLTRGSLARNADRKLAAARVLVQAGMWSDAYYLAGYAVEIALKAIVASRFRADEITDRKLVDSVYTHDVPKLVDLAGLGPDLDIRRGSPHSLGDGCSC